LQENDFEALSRAVDPFIDRTGGLNGLLIEMEKLCYYQYPILITCASQGDVTRCPHSSLLTTVKPTQVGSEAKLVIYDLLGKYDLFKGFC
jgi:hypothetical protein